jgi:DHA1 family tetracycline resistance protein-like MFS transporter
MPAYSFLHKLSGSKLWPVYLAGFLDQCALLVALPVLPIAFIEMGYSAKDAALYTGVAVSAFAASQLVSAPVGGYLADRYSRRLVLAGCGVLMAAGLFVSCSGSTSLAVLIGRAISGLGAGSRGVMAAAVGDATEAADRPLTFARLGACTSAALIIAPLLGGAISLLSWRMSFAFAGGLAILSAALCLTALPCRRLHSGVQTQRKGTTPELKALLSVVLISFFCSFANASFPTTLSIINAVRFDWTPLDTGLLFTVLGLSGLFMQVVVLPFILRRFGPQHLLPCSLAVGVVGLTTYAMATSSHSFYVGVPMMAVLTIAPPCLLALVSALARPETQGRTQSMMSVAAALAALLAPYPFSGLLAWQLSRDPMLVDLPALPFLLAGFCLLVAIGLYICKVMPLSPGGAIIRSTE